MVPLITNVWARELVHDLERRGICLRGLLTAARSSRKQVEHDNGWMPHRTHCALFEAAARATNDPLYGAKLGRQIYPRVAGVIAYVGLAADTLGQSAHNFAHYITLINKSEKVEVLPGTDRWIIRGHAQNPAAVQANTFADSLTVNVFSRMAGRGINPVTVGLPHAQPSRRDALLLEEFFGCSIHFNGPWDLTFNADDMACRVVTSDPFLIKVVKEYGDQLLREGRDTQPGIVQEIAATVIKQLPSQPVTTEAIAEAMGFSERTLRRRAGDAGTSVKEVVNRTRARLADQYEQSGQFKVKELAYLTGFKSTGAFSAARRRWK